MRALVEASSPWLTRDDAVIPSTSGSIDPDRMDALREALTQRNLIALTIYAELESALTGTYGRESAQKLNQAIRQLRFEDALTWLQQHETRPHS